MVDRTVIVDSDIPTVDELAHPRRIPKGFWREVLVMLWLYFVYDIINNLTPVRKETALAHSKSLFRLEHTLHIDPERALNEWLSRHTGLGGVLSNFYNLAHIWLTLALIIFLWWRRRPLYADLRNALVVCNLLAFAVFLGYPVAPPRMLDGFIDIIEQTGAISSFHEGALSGAANQYAAMPSLHVAWALWCLVALWRALPSLRWKILGSIHVALTCFVIVATGNHFVLDIVGGAITAAISFAAAHWFAQWMTRRRAHRATVALPATP